MRYKFLSNEPAAFVFGRERALVISDLHLGIEYELRKAGVHIPNQTEKLRKRLEKLAKETKAKHLVILGDIKNELFEPKTDLLEFFYGLKKKMHISIIKGNHDGDIEYFLPDGIDVYSSSGFSIDNVAFAHGNAWPAKGSAKCEALFTGHIHPAVRFRFGKNSMAEHCWLVCQASKELLRKGSKLKTIIVAPTFNPLAGSVAINEPDFKENGIAFKISKWKEGKVFLLDGTYIGKLKEIS